MLLGLDGLDPFEIRLITSKFVLIAFFLYSARALRALALKSGAQVDDIELIPNSCDIKIIPQAGHRHQNGRLVPYERYPKSRFHLIP